jgi:hypothetical protein
MGIGVGILLIAVGALWGGFSRHRTVAPGGTTTTTTVDQP